MRSYLKSSLYPTTAIILMFSLNVFAGVVSDTTAGQKTISKFMQSLARYVTWPDTSFSSADAPYKYCMLGEHALSDTLKERLEGKKIKKRNVEIIQLASDALEESKNCHIVFIGTQQPAEIRTAVTALAGSSILTTGDTQNFAGLGGMIGFIGEDKKVALQINKKRLEAGGLKASSKLFRVSSM